MPSQSVLVIGGGLAGMSSAVALAEAGFRVRLLEKRPHLGGRATSYTLPDGSEVDNCQHVTLGCCTNLADFYRRVGAGRKDSLLRPALFRGCKTAGARRSRVRGCRRRCTWRRRSCFSARLTLADKRGIAKALLAIARAGGHPPGIDGAYDARLAAPDEADAGSDRAILAGGAGERAGRRAFAHRCALRNRSVLEGFSRQAAQGYRVGIPSVPLANLYEGCREAVTKRGGEVTLALRRSRNSRGGGPLCRRDSGGRLRSGGGCVHRGRAARSAALDLLPEGNRRELAHGWKDCGI